MGSPGWCSSVGWSIILNWKVVGSIPGQSTYSGFSLDPLSGCIQEATNQCFSLASSLTLMFLSFPSSEGGLVAHTGRGSSVGGQDTPSGLVPKTHPSSACFL